MVSLFSVHDALYEILEPAVGEPLAVIATLLIMFGLVLVCAVIVSIPLVVIVVRIDRFFGVEEKYRLIAQEEQAVLLADNEPEADADPDPQDAAADGADACDDEVREACAAKDDIEPTTLRARIPVIREEAE